MEMKVLDKGQVTIPASMRRRLGIRSGDKLNADMMGDGIFITLSPERRIGRKARIVTDSLTGLPVIEVGQDAPILTSEMVREMLADFP